MLWSYRISDHDLRPNIHCPKNNHDLCIETEPVTVLHTLYTIGPLFFKSCTLYSTVYSTVTVCMYLAQKPDIYRCICYKCDRLNFYVKIQIIFWYSVAPYNVNFCGPERSLFRRMFHVGPLYQLQH